MGESGGHAFMKKSRNAIVILFLMGAVLSCLAQNIHGADGDDHDGVSLTTENPPPPPRLTLEKAVMCEGLKDLEPKNETIIFRVKLGSATCFTAFDPVPKKTIVYHNWFKRDQPNKKMKLILKPPKWASVSKIRIRKMDVGPWRVEITDSDGKLFRTLRFSVTE